MKNRKLRNELTSGRTRPDEVDELMQVAKRLGAVSQPRVSDGTRRKIQAISGSPSRAPLYTRLSVGFGFAVFLGLVFTAQYALPGSVLYGIRQLTDEIQAFIVPGSRDEKVQEKHYDSMDKQKAIPEEDLRDLTKTYEDDEKDTKRHDKFDESWTRNQRKYRNDRDDDNDRWSSYRQWRTWESNDRDRDNDRDSR